MDMKKITIIIFGFASNLSANTAEQTCTHTATGNTFVFHIDNSAHNQTAIKQNDAFSPCSAFIGQELKECILMLNPVERKNIIKKLPIYARRSFIHTLSFEEYRTWLSTYTQTEWLELYAAVSEHEKKNWPRIIQEQIDTLDAIVYEGAVAQVATEIGLLFLDTIPGFQPLHIALELTHIALYNKHVGAALYITKRFKEFIKRHYE